MVWSKNGVNTIFSAVSHLQLPPFISLLFFSFFKVALEII